MQQPQTHHANQTHPANQSHPAKKMKPAATTHTSGPIVHILQILCDSNHTHFHHLFPTVVLVGCKELAHLVFSGRLKPQAIHIRSPAIEDRDGEELAQIKASYDRFMTWYPNVYTVHGVTVTAPFCSSRDESTGSTVIASFFKFYDSLIFTHAHTIQVLKLDLTTPSLSIVSSFLDSVRMCSETRHLTLNMPCYWVSHKIFSLKAQEVIRYMLDLEHLSFSAFWYDPLLADPADPLESSHLLYLLPPSLVSLRLAGRISPAMARFNENAIAYMLCNRKLPCLTTVDLNAYRAPKINGMHGLTTRFAHPSSRVNRVVAPAYKALTYMSLRLTLDQANYLFSESRYNLLPFTLVIYHPDPAERASRVKDVHELIEKYEIENVLVDAVVE